MVFHSILEFSTNSIHGYVRSPMPPTTVGPTSVKSTSMEAASKARPPAGGKASDISTVIKATERAGACSWLKVRSRRPVEPRISAARSASVERVAMVEVAVVEIAAAAIKIVAIDDGSAVGDVGVVVVDHPMAMPVASPVMPAPTIPSEETDAEPDSKSNPRPSQEDPRHGIPAWICDDRVAIHQPRIIGRHVNHLRIGRFDDDCVALRCYLFLFIVIQVASLVSLLTHRLDGIRHILLLVGIRVAKGGTPREVLVHVFKNRGKLCKGLHAWVPGLVVDFFGQLFTLEVGMTLHPAVRLDNLCWIRGSSENLRNQGVRVQRDGRDQLLQLLGRVLHGRSR